MEAIIERCAGLDVHQESVVACAICGSLDRRPTITVAAYGTTTAELLALVDWLEALEITHVAMESTGVYWKPVWNLLEGHGFTLILANAQRIKNVPGRKTDMKDAEWIARLLRSGLIESSFVPPTDVRDLRDLTRYRKKLRQDATSEKNRIHKVLQDANIKLSSYMSDLFGVSGRAILTSLIGGEVITETALELLVHGRLRSKLPSLVEALNGRLRRHHRDMIRFSWDHLCFLEQQIVTVEREIESHLQAYREKVDLLSTLPGVKPTAAAAILAEIGPDVKQFPSAGQLASWAGVSPGVYQSAGKVKRVRTLPGNAMLKATLCECAWAASMSRDTRLSACYWRLVKRMGKKKALIALAHTMLRIIYAMLRDNKSYEEFGPDFGTKKRLNHEDRMVKQLKALGYTVSKVA
ncbi:MAG TPA: IS110 family transposase [Firmicutes bacterium]|jgi:transposase|nr:IS110 family transposase [Candidatus Fermentithermobacillaceae bacterium]HHX29196.1 IS110 family transposase [Candidatus Fermentithermobacillaceae bacterium]